MCLTNRSTWRRVPGMDKLDWWWGALWLPFVATILLLIFAGGGNT